MSAEAFQDRAWELPDDKLLQQCRFEAFVGSGPGGQKRHKTNAAVRYTHLPTGIHAIAADSRSQRENRIHALRNLRHKLAMGIRHDVDLLNFRPPAYLQEYPGLHMSSRNPLYAATLALVLDVLEAARWNTAHAALALGLSTSALVRFLHEDPAAWEHAKRRQADMGLKPLRVTE